MRARISGLGITKKLRRVSTVGSHHWFNEKAAIVALSSFVILSVLDAALEVGAFAFQYGSAIQSQLHRRSHRDADGREWN